MSKLQSQAIKSVKWTTFQTLFLGISAPLLTVMKARFLTPTEFGILAIVTVFFGLLQTINNFGISQSIIQRDNISKNELSSLFFFNIFLAILLGGIIYLLSDTLSEMFSMEELSYLLKMISLIAIINGPSLLFRALLEKSLYFKELSIIQMLSEVLLIIITIVLLIMGMGVLGVILGQIVSSILNVILIVILTKRKRKLNISLYFNLTLIKPFIKFGLFVSGKQIMTFVTHRADQLIIGYFLSPDVLGIYYFAKDLLEKLRTLITSSFSKVLFPLLSKMKNDINKLAIAYKKITSYIAIFAFPVFIGIALTSHLFVPIIFGEVWMESIPFFRVFSLVLIPLVLTANLATSLLYSLNKPNIVFYIDLIMNIIYISSLMILAENGIFVILTLYSIYIVIKTAILQVITNSYLKNSFLDYLMSFNKVVLSSFIMVVCVIIMQLIMQNKIDDILQLIISGFIGIFIYVITTLKFDKKSVLEIKNAILRNKIST